MAGSLLVRSTGGRVGTPTAGLKEVPAQALTASIKRASAANGTMIGVRLAIRRVNCGRRLWVFILALLQQYDVRSRPKI